MAEIIYLKDILLEKANETAKSVKKAISTRSGRLRPFKADRLLKSSLIEKKKEDTKRH